MPASQDGEFLWIEDMYRGNSVKLTDGYRPDYRQWNIFLSTFCQFQEPCTIIPVWKQSGLLYKILKSRVNKTSPQRIHSLSGDN